MKIAKRDWMMLGLVALLIAAFVFTMFPTDPKLSFIAEDIAKDHSRFTPTESVDVAMAMKLITHDPPHMLNPIGDQPVLLLYPPTTEDLAKLSGE
jgi:hypothetical protein